MANSIDSIQNSIEKPLTGLDNNSKASNWLNMADPKDVRDVFKPLGAESSASQSGGNQLRFDLDDPYKSSSTDATTQTSLTSIEQGLVSTELQLISTELQVVNLELTDLSQMLAGFQNGAAPALDSAPAATTTATQPSDASPANGATTTQPSDASPSGAATTTQPSDASPASGATTTQPSDASTAITAPSTQAGDASTASATDATTTSTANDASGDTGVQTTSSSQPGGASNSDTSTASSTATDTTASGTQPGSDHNSTTPSQNETIAQLTADAKPGLNYSSLANWNQLHQANVTEAGKAAAAGSQLEFFGDSITALLGDQNMSTFATDFAGDDPQAFGIKSDTSEDLLYRVNNGEFQGTPKVAVINIGTNDTTGVENNQETVQQVVDNVDKTIESIQDRSPDTKVLLMGLLPRSTNMTAVNEINAGLSTLGNGSSVVYDNIDSSFENTNGTQNTSLYSSDGLHPNAAGDAEWASATKNVITQMLS